MWAQFDGEHVAGAAKRRRERRHRAYLKYVRMSVAMALSEYKHRTSRGQSGQGQVRSTRVHGQVPEALLPQEPGTQHFTLDDDDSVPELGGSRPDRIATLSGPQERDLRRTLEQIVDAVPLVPLLDDPVPQTVEQLQDVLQFFDRLSAVPEPVIEVPKIYTEDVPMRAVLRATQLAEQLVEVPTIISFPMIALFHAIMAQRTVEQNVDIPAVGGSGTGGGPSGFLPGQNSSVTAEQIVDNPVRPGGAGDLQGFPRGQGSTAFSEQIPEFPDPGGGRQDFQPVQGSAASSSDLPGQAGQGFFRTFPQNKKSATQPPHSRSELPPHSSPWTPAAYDASMVLEEEEEEEEECEEDFEVEYVEFDNRLWGREWDPARQQYCWWLASADGSQVGHAIWRPPWLIGRGPG